MATGGTTNNCAIAAEADRLLLNARRWPLMDEPISASNCAPVVVNAPLDPRPSLMRVHRGLRRRSFQTASVDTPRLHTAPAASNNVDPAPRPAAPPRAPLRRFQFQFLFRIRE
jgi:hypothetical protein